VIETGNHGLFAVHPGRHRNDPHRDITPLSQPTTVVVFARFGNRLSPKPSRVCLRRGSDQGSLISGSTWLISRHDTK
jgi:hypothetical protein